MEVMNGKNIYCLGSTCKPNQRKIRNTLKHNLRNRVKIEWNKFMGIQIHNNLILGKLIHFKINKDDVVFDLTSNAKIVNAK
jgi:hypothetical protein